MARRRAAPASQGLSEHHRIATNWPGWRDTLQRRARRARHADHDRLAVWPSRAHGHGARLAWRHRPWVRQPHVGEGAPALVEQAWQPGTVKAGTTRPGPAHWPERLCRLVVDSGDARAGRRAVRAGRRRASAGAAACGTQAGQVLIETSPSRQVAALAAARRACARYNMLEIGRREAHGVSSAILGLAPRSAPWRKLDRASGRRGRRWRRDRTEGLGQAARQHAAHLQRIANARRHLGVVGQHIPAPIALPHQVDGVLREMPRGSGTIGDPAGAQEVAVGVH